MQPSERYRQAIEANGWQDDPEQRALLPILDRCHRTWCGSVWQRWHAPKGLYLWGGVGIGKSALLSLLFETLTVPKAYMHFHVFMSEVQQALRRLDPAQDPLVVVAKQWAQDIEVLYLDELVVADIADAMILHGLLSALVDAGVKLLISANRGPQALYLGGTNRTAFLPTIDWMEATLEVKAMASKQDYRTLSAPHTGRYVVHPTSEISPEIEACFQTWANGQTLSSDPLQVCGRTVEVVKHAKDVVWFDYAVLCAPPRAAEDYLALVARYQAWVLTGVPILHRPNRIALFIKLLDVLYEHNVRLALQAEVPIKALCAVPSQAFRFERAASRLKRLTD